MGSNNINSGNIVYNSDYGAYAQFSSPSRNIQFQSPVEIIFDNIMKLLSESAFGYA